MALNTKNSQNLDLLVSANQPNNIKLKWFSKKWNSPLHFGKGIKKHKSTHLSVEVSVEYKFEKTLEAAFCGQAGLMLIWSFFLRNPRLGLFILNFPKVSLFG